VSADRVGETPLLRHGVAGQSQGDRHRHVAGVEAILQLRSEPPGQQQAPFHPGLLASQKLGDGAHREAVLLRQGSDHAGLIHRAGSLGRRVGLEQAGLAADPRNRFDDHGYLTQAIGTPLRQTLETVEHLELSVVPLSHAQRQGSQVAVPVGTATAQRCQRGVQSIDRNLLYERHGATSGRGRIWYSG
jgi:hypothetical protein